MANDKHVYRVIFANQGEIFEVYAERVYQGALFGFVEVEGLIFGSGSGLLVDPSEEKLKGLFGGVKRTYIPLHAVVRIDEVEKQGQAKISVVTGSDGKVTPFPVYTPGKGGA